MLERLKQIVSQSISLLEPRGVFLSAFDSRWNLLVSSGVMTTDKTLGQALDMLYHGLIESQKNTDHILVDIVQTIEIITSPETLKTINIQSNGIALATTDHTKSGVLLPATMWVSNAFDALSLLKKKHNIEWNIVMYTFTTQRIAVK